MLNPTFSIITICFNSALTIERTIKSVLSQTYTDYEYIIVDGGSTDSTLDVIKNYESLFEGRMKWKSESDNGIYDAMNKGIERSSGTIIGIVNSDDWLEQDALSLVNSKFLENERREDCLYCGGIIFHQDGEKHEWMVNLKSFYRQAPLFVMSGIRHPATFVPKKVYDKMGLFDADMKLSADQDFILRCCFAGIEFFAIDKYLSNMAAGGISTCGEKKAWQYSKHDRKLMLHKYGKTGLSYIWFYYSWVLRNKVKKIVTIFHCNKG